MGVQDLITVGQYSDRGVKEENQDSFGVLVPEDTAIQYKGIVAVIADGVSGCAQGKVASETSAKSLLSDYYCTPDSWTVKSSVEKVLLATNRWLYGQGQQVTHNSHRGLATTLSALVIKSSTAHLFHIGDTRIYRLNDREFELLTQDHRVWVSGEKNYLTRALGIDLRLDIDYRKLPVQIGDIFLQTTDGVYEFVSDEVMRQLIDSHRDNLDRAAREITRLALENGSDDNVSCQILRIDDLPGLGDEAFYQKLTELPFPPPLSAGMILDGYRVLREIHASKRTQVYLAEDTDTGSQVVLKTPSVNFEDDPTYLDLFMHEEWVGNRLSSNHVLKVIEQQRPRRFLYYVSEYIEGITLRSWMHDHPESDLNETREIIQQLSRGLLAFHKLEMIHQDLKPENVMIDNQGTVKIIDFGSTKIAGVEEISSPLERLTLLGTKNYTAPEYLLGHPCSPRSDIFSLGVISYEMLTGKLPFGEKYDESSIHTLGYTPARRWVPDLPIWVDGALEKALRKNPERRYGELSEFVHDLSNPNPEFLREKHEPLLVRNPLAFWRGLAVTALFLNVLLVAKLVF
ncbi:MAG TPA: protein kinase [Porticoccaceae bacterium]|nr:protein kinase [Porticoccaceae bacterium]HCO59001.1 protein kinase [Porticoccaceae bacterium]